jgi:heme-degrading monooxygenase HmoA
MIARTWRGWAPAATADDYQHHYEAEVAEHLRQVSGFCGARLLRRHDGDEVMFTSITFFTSMDDVRTFAGEDPSKPWPRRQPAAPWRAGMNTSPTTTSPSTLTR